MNPSNPSNPFKKVVDCYKDYLGERLISIVLFGSQARGEAKESSDYDLFIVADGLPPKPFKRVLFIRSPLKGQFPEKFCIIAKTPQEIMTDFPPLFLDLGLDGIILFDRDNFFKKIQIRIKEIIHQAGLQRKRDERKLCWEWQNPPRKGWELTWSGYREL
ncbi:MAG: nucleotidyltransferase domain-containing protein [Desulfobacterales bacterium]|nr:nucleotidyltransferase domain-containing protein [Desulfobacterales bacterium]